jgi:hypothetical protein
MNPEKQNPEKQNSEKQNPEKQNPVNNPVDDRNNRREALIGVGKFAAYAAPFTLLSRNAKAATGSGPAKHR